MAYYKFLTADRRGPFSDTPWPWHEGDVDDDAWVETSGDVAICRRGIHACRAADLPYWLNPVLWEVELEGPVVESTYKVVGTRGRLVRRLDQWDRHQERIFRMVCVCRTCEHATAELRAGGLDSMADLLAGTTGALRNAVERTIATAAEVSPGPDTEDSQWAGEAHAVLESIGAADRAANGQRYAKRLCEYASDALGYADDADTAAVAFVAAHAYDSRTQVDVADPFRSEREWQAAWLAERLRIA